MKKGLNEKEEEKKRKRKGTRENLSKGGTQRNDSRERDREVVRERDLF